LKKEDGNFKDMSPTILSVRRRVRRVEFWSANEFYLRAYSTNGREVNECSILVGPEW
jgi:hypothetical protein